MGVAISDASGRVARTSFSYYSSDLSLSQGEGPSSGGFDLTAIVRGWDPATMPLPPTASRLQAWVQDLSDGSTAPATVRVVTSAAAASTAATTADATAFSVLVSVPPAARAGGGAARLWVSAAAVAGLSSSGSFSYYSPAVLVGLDPPRATVDGVSSAPSGWISVIVSGFPPTASSADLVVSLAAAGGGWSITCDGTVCGVVGLTVSAKGLVIRIRLPKVAASQAGAAVVTVTMVALAPGMQNRSVQGGIELFVPQPVLLSTRQ